MAGGRSDYGEAGPVPREPEHHEAADMWLFRITAAAIRCKATISLDSFSVLSPRVGMRKWW